MPDLFTCDLAGVTAEDVRAFLQLDAPPGERPGEATRIDYKQDATQDLADTVCAFTNTFGGLVFVGIAEENGRPTELVGVPKGRAELKTRLASIIQSTVYPRPPFSIHIVDMPDDPGREIAIVRVVEGDWPPYMFIKDRQNKVSVRVEDSCVHAPYSDLESLFRRRDLGAEALENRPIPGPDLRATITGEDGKVQDSKTWARLRIRPVRPLRGILDQREEADVCRSLSLAFDGTRLTEVVQRDVASFDVNIGGSNLERLTWRSYDDGTQTMAANVATNEPGGPVLLLALLVHRWIRALRAAHTILEERGWLGRVEAHSTLVFGGAHPSNAVFLGVDLFDELDGVENSTVQLEGFTTRHLVDQSKLAVPAPLIAELLVRHLRAQLGFAADFDAVAKAVKSASLKVTRRQR